MYQSHQKPAMYMYMSHITERADVLRSFEYVVMLHTVG